MHYAVYLMDSNYLQDIISCPTYTQMSYYTSVAIVLYTIYIKFLHENYYQYKTRFKAYQKYPQSLCSF
jgi:hypothetical protein